MSAWTWLRAHPWAGYTGGACVLAAASFGAGRYMAPTKTLETERVVERQVIDEKYTAAKVAEARTTWEREVVDHTRVVTKYVEGKVIERIEYRDRETASSGGTVTVRTEYVDRIVKVEVEKVVEVTKLVERDCPRVTLAATVGAGFRSGAVSPPAYGVEALGRVLGPLVVGAGAEGNATGGAARVIAGIQF